MLCIPTKFEDPSLTQPAAGGRPFTLQREVYELLEKGFLSPQNSLRPRAEEWFWTKWLDPFPGNLFLETCRGV